MLFQNVKSSSLPTLLCVLATLAGCGSAPPVFRDRVIKIPVPVRAELDPRLTADCEPRSDVPSSGPLPISAVLDRLASVEEALAQCRNQLSEIRGLK